MKKTYNYKKIDKGFREWLEGRTGHKVKGLTLLYPNTEVEAPEFWRFRLEGVKDKSFGNNLVRSLFMSMTPDLRYIFGDSLIRVCVEVQSNTLILDFKHEESIYQKIDTHKYLELVQQIQNKTPRKYERLIEVF